jgi:hypothetical protein
LKRDKNKSTRKRGGDYESARKRHKGYEKRGKKEGLQGFGTS